MRETGKEGGLPAPNSTGRIIRFKKKQTEWDRVPNPQVFAPGFLVCEKTPFHLMMVEGTPRRIGWPMLRAGRRNSAQLIVIFLSVLFSLRNDAKTVLICRRVWACDFADSMLLQKVCRQTTQSRDQTVCTTTKVAFNVTVSRCADRQSASWSLSLHHRKVSFKLVGIGILKFPTTGGGVTIVSLLTNAWANLCSRGQHTMHLWHVLAQLPVVLGACQCS